MPTYVIIGSIAVITLFGVGFFCLGREVWRCWRSRRLLGGVAAALGFVALLWLGLMMGFVPGSAAYKSYRFSTALFGQNFDLGPPRDTYDEPSRSFTGDGQWVKVYHLPEELVRWVANPPPEFQTSLPKRLSIPPTTFIRHWHPTPVSADELKFLEQWIGREAVSEPLFQRLVGEPGNYVAFEYYKPDRYSPFEKQARTPFITSVTIYLLSPSERILIDSFNKR